MFDLGGRGTGRGQRIARHSNAARDGIDAGWREIVAFLKEAGYRVICIDQKATHGTTTLNITGDANVTVTDGDHTITSIGSSGVSSCRRAGTAWRWVSSARPRT